MTMGQEIIRGSGGLASILSPYRRIFLVHGRSFWRQPVRDMFDGLSCVHFTAFQPNPLYEQVCEGVELFEREGCDAIVAVGGGSAIDVAKCVKLFSGQDRGKRFPEREPVGSGIPLVAVPTTAGTGSESTGRAVIYRGGRKQSIAHQSILPDVAVLAPELLISLPPYQKKCAMMDALCQAVESWWSAASTPISASFSKSAIRLVRDNWRAYIGANDPDAGANVMEAANLSGRAIDITATTAPHAMSYKLSTLCRIPHGHAVALCMAEVWPYMASHTDRCDDLHGKKRLESVLAEISDLLDFESFHFMMEDLGLAGPMAGLRREDAGLLADSVNPERLANNPMRLDSGTLRSFYERMAEK